MDLQPTITFADAAEGATLVVVQRGDTRRHFEVAPERVESLLVSVLISEFGLAQADAQSRAATELRAKRSREDAASLSAEKVAAYDRMAADLGAAQKQVAELQAQVAQQSSRADAAATQAAQLQEQVTKLQAEVAAAKQPAPAPAAPTEPAKPAGDAPKASA